MNKVVEKGKVSSYQVTILIITIILGTALIFVPSIVTKSAKQDGWLSIIAGGIIGIMAVLIATLLGRRFPGKTLVEYSGDIIGRWPGKVIGAAYVLFYLITGAVIAKEFTDLLNSMFLPNTPALVITFFLILMGGVAVNKGIEVIVRANEFILPLFLGSIFAIVLLVIVEVDLRRLTPIMAEGWAPVFKGSMVPAGWMGEATVLLMLVPYINSPNESTRAGIKAVVFVAVIQILVFVSTVGVMAPNVAAAHRFSFLGLARYIQVAEFLTRVEPLVMISWVTGVTIKISVFYFVTVAGAAQVIGLKDYRYLVIPIGTAFIALSELLWPNSVTLVQFLDQIWPLFFALPFQMLIPLGFLLLAIMRKKGGIRGAK